MSCLHLVSVIHPLPEFLDTHAHLPQSQMKKMKTGGPKFLHVGGKL